jgi:tRNA(Ile)-lysidine synthase
MIWESFKKTIQRYEMIRPGDKVLAAVSGGPDSVCLLHLLVRLKKNMPFTLTVVHCNHGLRLHDAGNDQAFVEKLCRRLQVPCVSLLLPVRETSRARAVGLEEAGRDLRYEAFASLSRLRGFTRVALGHNQDDQAETVLFRIIRGTGPAGLSGIPPRRLLGETRASVIRPLLFSARKDIERYARSHRIPWRRDKSNNRVVFARNRIRVKLLPLLREYNPNISAHLARLSESLWAENEYWAHEIPRIIKHIRAHTGYIITLDLKKFNKYHIMIRNRIIQYLLSGSIDNAKLRLIIQLCGVSGGRKRIEIRHYGYIEKSKSVVRFIKKISTGDIQ